MRTDTGQTTLLANYAPTPYAAPTVELDIALDPQAAKVRATTRFERREGVEPGAPLRLAGDGLSLDEALRDGVPLGEGTFEAEPDHFVLRAPPAGDFTLTLITTLAPDDNTELMGLYRSNGIYCTQCEAEGFRRITYAYDRPDVLSRYRVAIRGGAPGDVLLSNGNLVEEGLADGASYAVWDDPFPKPTYLFALVAGRLGTVRSTYETPSGKRVNLAIHVEPGKEPRAGYAMDALIRSMKWDERRFGREYDLDVFNIVAVSDFNMGAMENKGLNVFNDRYVLADPDVATDADYAGIETVIAHEYFHNWTGNRITCRDWFQLCLKEGLTVFRDQEFTADERSRPVKRIEDVRRLRQAQFREDASPLRHPVRPSRYDEISNLYTATVYEKGAEVIRVLETLIGEDAFRAGMDRYFARFDGIAATVEDFLSCFDIDDRAAFMRWYEEPGTPSVEVDETFEGGAYTLTLTQVPAEEASAKPIPVRVGLIEHRKDLDLSEATVTGGSLAGDVIVLGSEPATLSLSGLQARPRASVLRGFCAPVHIVRADDTARDLDLLAEDTDPFSIWDAGQRLALATLTAAYHGRAPSVQALGEALSTAVLKFSAEPAFRALLLALPPRGTLVETIAQDVRAAGVDEAHRAITASLAQEMAPALRELASVPAPPAEAVDAVTAGERALRNAAVSLLVHAGDDTLARAQATSARNMTDRLAALGALAAAHHPAADDALEAFGDAFKSEPLVLDKYFALQALRSDEGAVARVQRLMDHPSFSLSNPNRVRSLIGAFAQNVARFHATDGSGYQLVGGVVRELDAKNPQLAARLLTAFGDFRRYDGPTQKAAATTLEEVARAARSSDVADIARRLTKPPQQT